MRACLVPNGRNFTLASFPVQIFVRSMRIVQVPSNFRPDTILLRYDFERS